LYESRENNLYKSLGRKRRRRNMIKEGRDSKILSIEIILIQINKIIILRMNRKGRSLGKRGRTPIKYWGCKEDHMYKDFPHREVKMRTLHNIKYMGINIPRIYVALED
jgi:hypothetical protein